MGLFKKILSSLSGNSYEEEEMETEVINSEIAAEEDTTAAKHMAAATERKLEETQRKLEVAQRKAEEKSAKQTAWETSADKEIEEEGPTIIDDDYIDELIKNGIKEVILPASVEEICTDCWDDFVSIDMSKCHKLTKINVDFQRGKSLERIEFPDSITSIEKHAFYGCKSLKSIVLPKNLTSIGDCTFNECESLESIVLPENLTSIGECAFWECKSLKSIVLPKNLTSIGKYAFNGCESLESIVLPKNLTSIGEWAFECCKSLEDVDLSLCEKLKKIDTYTFSSCKSLEIIKLPDNLTSIGEYAFDDCVSLRNIEIPDTVKEIESDAFSGCKLLRKLSLSESLKRLGSLGDCSINVDFSKCKNIKVLNERLNFANKILVLPMGVEEIMSDALTSNVEELYLPPTIKVMGDSYFYNCPNIYCYAPKLESLELEDFNGTLFVLPQYYDSYCEQASIEGANIQVEKIPDDKLYFYDE